MENTIRTQSITDFSEILQTYGVPYIPSGFYWQVGEIRETQGWILHLSVIMSQLPRLLELIIPELVTNNIPFKIIRDEKTAQNVYEGALGYINLGKIVSIYPLNDTQANGVAKRMLNITMGFRGPAVPTDLLLGGILSTRYGSHNPIIIKDARGQPVKHIYDVNGQLIPDPYHIPFSLPGGIKWPFENLASPVIPARRKLLNYAYYPLGIIKPDVKGVVMKALYFKNIWQIRSCLIKEGRRNMFADPEGRDIQDRLKWQNALYQELKNDIPMPEVFDYFEEHGDTYLALQFINGISLQDWIAAIHKNRCWRHLSNSDRLQLLDQLLKILTIIQTLHEKGFVHRDITPVNFLIDKKGRIFLIDLELAWSGRTGQPDPPFRLGTLGHMSPEQQRIEQPTVKEDVYGLGALMVTFFTGLFATKLDVYSPERLKNCLLFLTGEDMIAGLIRDCLALDPVYRPGLSKIKNTLLQVRAKLQNAPLDLRTACPCISPDLLQETIQSAIRGLGLWQTLNEEMQWVSPTQREELHIGNEQVETTVYKGWHIGMAGPLWLIARASRAGFITGDCQAPFSASWDYIMQHYFQAPENSSPGLYSGGAGIALALAEALNSNTMDPTPKTLERLKKCFLNTADNPSLADGIAGQGIALLYCRHWVEKNWVEKRLNKYLDLLTSQQLPDGSWAVINDPEKQNDTLMGLDYGIAGISWFLLAYEQYHPTAEVRDSIQRSLRWLIKYAGKERKYYSWPISRKNPSIETWNTGLGLPGILLLFIKAHTILKDPLYRQIATNGLLNYPAHPILMDYSLYKGLAGLGEMYIEAFKAFEDPIWQERADWIAGLFAYTCKTPEEGVSYWLSDMSNLTSDLFIGNGGIVHFLLRHQSPEKWVHPLWM